MRVGCELVMLLNTYTSSVAFVLLWRTSTIACCEGLSMMFAQLILTTCRSPLFVPMIAFQRAGSPIPGGQARGPSTTPGTGAGVVSVPGPIGAGITPSVPGVPGFGVVAVPGVGVIRVDGAVGAVGAGVTWLPGPRTSPGTKAAPRPSASARTTTIAAIAAHRLRFGRGGG